MSGPEKFAFRFFSDARPSLLSIMWAMDRADYTQGDCYVVVRPTETVTRDVAGGATAMTVEQIRAYVAAKPGLLGELIHDCLGIIVVDDKQRVELFAEPIRVRNHHPAP